MATSTHHLESGKHTTANLPLYEQIDLDDDRIMIDIETAMAIQSHIESELEKPTQRIPYFLLEGRTLGPVAVLLILVFYTLLSPLLSPAIHEYIYRILH
jgi:hypothetical protein